MSNFRAALIALLIAGSPILAATYAPPANAEATKIGDRTTTHTDKRVARVERWTAKGEPTLVQVQFRDGSVFVFTPCKREDSRNCFWDAGRSGNGRGRSFVDLRGKTYRVPARALV